MDNNCELYVSRIIVCGSPPSEISHGVSYETYEISVEAEDEGGGGGWYPAVHTSVEM